MWPADRSLAMPFFYCINILFDNKRLSEKEKERANNTRQSTFFRRKKTNSVCVCFLGYFRNQKASLYLLYFDFCSKMIPVKCDEPFANLFTLL